MIKSFIIGAILAFFALGFTQLHTQDRPVHKSYPPIESPWRNNFGAMP